MKEYIIRFPNEDIKVKMDLILEEGLTYYLNSTNTVIKVEGNILKVISE